MKPSLIVHGGAWDIPDEQAAACQAGCRRALEAGWAVLSRGGAALDAVEAAIVVLEDDPVFDAGTGSHLNLDGHVECDAIVMEGAELRAGAVAGLRRIRNPIRLARKLMENGPHMMIAGEGAERYAVAQGLALCDPEELVTSAERAAWQLCRQGKHAAAHHRGHDQGTVGAVALDGQGRLVAATSTGGTCCKLPGRIGDSPLVGCGCYADSGSGGVSCTGYGEGIMKIVMAKSAVELLRRPVNAEEAPGDLAMLAAREAVRLLAERAGATGGLILVDREGHPGYAFNTPRMAWGLVQPDGSFRSGL